MAVTGLRSQLGRTIGVLVCLCLTAQAADTPRAVLDLLGSMAAALTAVNPAEFMNAFDKGMPEYSRLKDQVTALVNQTEITSSIESMRDDGDDNKRSMDLDWYLQVRSLYPDGPIVNRREVIHCEIVKQKNKWKITSIKPLDFFAPAKLDK